MDAKVEWWSEDVDIALDASGLCARRGTRKGTVVYSLIQSEFTDKVV